ncbi:uncharacterized protein M6B38_202405 [Iris pallida]|uniref:R3H domain-containing protein 2-like n=1 Tax=Iris pallida TaxID=29817 RepID=A0AAX6EAA9_IRIPA|nr:uncharacterized protein M6B38_202405 [Iris pallida]
MVGSTDEIGAPDSWEMADLDETMSRMLLLSSSSSSSSKKASSSVPSNPEFYDESAPASDAMGLGGGDRRGGFSEEALSQVDQFLREALDKPRERLSILRMEQDVEKFLHDRTQHQLEFQSLPTSYLRLAAHRIAQHYYLQSLVLPDNSLPDGSGSRIVLIKTPESRFPAVRLADIPVSQPQEDVNTVKVAIKQRPQKGSQNASDPNACSSRTGHPKTVEERKEEYNRARARIFSSSGGAVTKPESDSAFEDSFQFCPITTSRSEEKSVFDGHESTIGRGSSSSSGSSRTNKNKTEKEPVVSRYRPSNRVAIFRDREVERKDPDYDRNYDRYTQRFDPGFGFVGGPYTIQPLFLPSVNYNTEFPQLGSGHRPQISIEHQPQPIPQHIHGPWPSTSTPGAIGYGPPEAMIPTFDVNRIGSHPTSSMYMHSSQYSVPFRPGISFVRPHELVQPFAQTHQQHSEARFGLARPR